MLDCEVMFKNLTTREKYFLSLCAFLFTLLLTGGGIRNVTASSESKDIFEELEVFTDVLAIVQSDYVDKPESKQLVKGAIKGMLATLDPHSSYLDPDSYGELETQTKGEFGGLGIEITIKDGLIVVVSPMEDSPAAKAGVQSGDAIVKIEGEFTKDYSLSDVANKLRGKKGTIVNISVQRQNISRLLDYTIVRDVIKIQSIKKRYLGDGYGYIRISQFMEKTSTDLEKSLKKLQEENYGEKLKGLIIDVRNNPGGLLTEAIKVCDLFLEEGVIVYTKGRLKDQKQKFYARDSGDEPEYPLIVLVNGGSASASEILAGALKDHGRALIVGTQSFGKGSVQTVNPLHNGGALTLTTALYYTKSGNSIQAKGVKPDILVEQQLPKTDNLPPSQPLKIRESELPGAIKNPDGAKDPESMIEKINQTPTVQETYKPVNPEETPLNEWLTQDNQFQRAYDLLKTFNILRK